MPIGIGIDTGGTYTDAVVYDFDQRKILGAAKALTTRRDLAVGILAALDRLPLDPAVPPDLVALSTTLATNACVENRLGRGRLVFFGGDPDTLDSHGPAYGLPSAADIHVLPCQATLQGDRPAEPDWDLFRARMEAEAHTLDGVGIVEMFSIRNGAVVEKKARELLRAVSRVPAVCGHELFGELNSLQRAASVLLNASLFPVIGRFLAAIRAAMAQRGFHVPVVIVRSDGSLMGESFAERCPVETLLCGPAASVIGAAALADEPDAVIVDMGGTTTDLALISAGQPVQAPEGVAVGRWRTFVKGLYINTFGLGGDSAVHWADGALRLEDYRVTPLCLLSSQTPGLLAQLADEVGIPRRHTRPLHECYVLLRDLDGDSRYTADERRFAAALRDGPLIRRRAHDAAGLDLYNFDDTRLLREGVVQLAGLTPTDAMHLKGDFNLHDVEASRLAAAFAAFNLDCPPEAFADRVYDAVIRKMYVNIVKSLMAHASPESARCAADPAVERLILESYRVARSAAGDAAPPFLATHFRTHHVLVGVGAPVGVFLPEVARLLGTRAVTPAHAEVANALGAIVGKIHVRREVEVAPIYAPEGLSGYSVYGPGGRLTFEERTEAEATALALAREEAVAEARRRGGSGEIEVSAEMGERKAATRDGELYLGGMAVAHAVAAAGF